jgi:hypothetical protein
MERIASVRRKTILGRNANRLAEASYNIIGCPVAANLDLSQICRATLSQEPEIGSDLHSLGMITAASSTRQNPAGLEQLNQLLFCIRRWRRQISAWDLVAKPEREQLPGDGEHNRSNEQSNHPVRQGSTENAN